MRCRRWRRRAPCRRTETTAREGNRISPMDTGWLYSVRARRSQTRGDRNRVAVARDLGSIGLAVEHAEGAALPFGGLDRETARGKREEIGRQRLGFGKGQAQPPRLRFAASAPFATACQVAGRSRPSVQRAFRSG